MRIYSLTIGKLLLGLMSLVLCTGLLSACSGTVVVESTGGSATTSTAIPGGSVSPSPSVTTTTTPTPTSS